MTNKFACQKDEKYASYRMVTLLQTNIKLSKVLNCTASRIQEVLGLVSVGSIITICYDVLNSFSLSAAVELCRWCPVPFVKRVHTLAMTSDVVEYSLGFVRKLEASGSVLWYQ